MVQSEWQRPHRVTHAKNSCAWASREAVSWVLWVHDLAHRLQTCCVLLRGRGAHYLASGSEHADLPITRPPAELLAKIFQKPIDNLQQAATMITY